MAAIDTLSSMETAIEYAFKCFLAGMDLQNTLNKFKDEHQICSACGGSGKGVTLHVPRNCSYCHGTGFKPIEENIKDKFRQKPNWSVDEIARLFPPNREDDIRTLFKRKPNWTINEILGEFSQKPNWATK